MEEEATNGIFSMKSDHVFNELSDSEEFSSEAWSLYSDVNGACEESVHGGGRIKDNWTEAKAEIEEDGIGRDDEMGCEAEMADDVGTEAEMANEDDIGRDNEMDCEAEMADDMGNEAEMADDVASRCGKQETEGKKFEFLNVEDGMMGGDGSDKQKCNEYPAIDIEKPQKSHTNSNFKGKTQEDIDFVPDTLTGHLMKSQTQHSNNGESNTSGPSITGRNKEQMQDMAHGPSNQAYPGEDGNWALEGVSRATSMGLDGSIIRNGSNERATDKVVVENEAETDQKQLKDKGSLA
ncbi:hypothetical protein SLA2020_112170 [Shorea laevis]